MEKIKKFCITGLLVFSLFISGCTAVSHQPIETGENAMKIQLTSPSFSEGGMIPKKFTCDTEDVSPALSWTGIPGGTKSIALIVDDPDAPAGIWVHWVLFNLPADLTGLSEGVKGVGVEGKNDFKKLGYWGPCPPRGSIHRYYFKIYALDTSLNLPLGAAKREVETAMQGHILNQGQIMGKYGR